MNLPNKLTLLRVILIPVFLICIYVDAIPVHFLLALIIFAAASFTDMLDGKIARARGLVTNFGKFLDPLADKVLVITALTVFVELDEFRMSAIPLVIITAREFMVSGLRLLAAEEGVVIAAGIWGKLKTAFTMVTIVGVLLYLSLVGDFSLAVPDFVRTWVLGGLIWISTILTIISGLVYLKGSWKYIDSDK
ncbi:CDP-diacylglycerol--glycerol-3-phosphate 3-phosphatidyltransferase [Ruminococcus sp.]|uniref:CDP-diacylglycerol--glycerol-3-phosphate 3-phosphatidyltransferase n=1 Tax=Ruminococcus sp. TaxID=41978 RepID=UPI0025E1A2B3|nr:CDP-diacylglycerol--glycerol-3-phosphate 3-phosphatidyltransferase [Ruminococcus sp.]